jgi:hypothetical protein
MTASRRWALRVGLPMAALALGGLVLGLCGLRVSRAEGEVDPNREIVRQVTVFAILATPEGKAVDTKLAGLIGSLGAASLANPEGRTVDSKLTTILPQLNRLLPHHGFKLLDVQSARIVAGETVNCKLGHGYTAETTLLRPIDENGKVQLRCELSLDHELQFSATVRTPLDQIFFCERPFLTDGSRLLIGMGVRW